MSADPHTQRLDDFYHQVQITILSRQNPLTGLLPASTAVNAHGDYTDAWVRDNVYSILAAWGLALAYRKLDLDLGRAYELEHSVIKLMRGLLAAMMRQAQKVERFKETQSPSDALHAKYETTTGDTVVGDLEWGHLQLDATSLYLLMLAQMTASGLAIIYTLDEVDFVQNLVYYIGRTYRTPDYGIWERGNKINHGNPELNASSLGMAKAALGAMNGLNLFGVRGGPASVIHVLPDEIARSRATLESLLPRESSSKEVDAALLSVISFPAFAVESQELSDRTRTKILDKLAGRYGCKRFLRDGHQTVLEDTTRLHYEPLELLEFEQIECEWPLFFTYLYLDGLFRRDKAQIETYRTKLAELTVLQNGQHLLPELYYVPESVIEAERANPQSQTRLPNENVPLVWAQSLYLLGQLLDEELLELGDIDPLGRHLRVKQLTKPVVQIALLAEDEALQAQLSAYGIETETPDQVAPIEVRPARELGELFTRIGQNPKLQLTGRPHRRMRVLSTSRIFRVRDKTVVFLPALLDQQQFYLTIDPHFLVSQIRSELVYLQRHWSSQGRPTLTLLLSHQLLETEGDETEIPLLALLREFQTGDCNGVSVKLGHLNQLMLTACVERINPRYDQPLPKPALHDAELEPSHLPINPEHLTPLSVSQEVSLELETDTQRLLERLSQTDNLYEQVEVLSGLVRLQGLDYETGLTDGGKPLTVEDLLDDCYAQAIELRCWGLMRRVAGLNDKVVTLSLADAVTDILARQKQIAVGRAYSEDSVISSPLSPSEILDKIRRFCREDLGDRVLTQEMLIYLNLLLKEEPGLFDGLLTLRVGYLILLLTSDLARDRHLTQDEAYDQLLELSPHEIQAYLQRVMVSYKDFNQRLIAQESLHTTQSMQEIDWVVLPVQSDSLSEDWLRKRQLEGSVNRVPTDFYPQVWQVLQHCKGVVIGDKLERSNRLDSAPLLAEMTPGEKNFALRVEHLLNKIQSPEYRQLNIETLMELAAIAVRNAELFIDDYIVLDVLIGHAVRLKWLDLHPESAADYGEQKAAAWRHFYTCSPYDCAQFIVNALKFLTQAASETLEEAPVSLPV